MWPITARESRGGECAKCGLEILRTDIKYVCGTCIFIKLIIFTVM